VLSSVEVHELDAIRAFFESKNRAFVLHEDSPGWEVAFPIRDYPSSAPFATGASAVEAARNALALWYERPDLGGRVTD
jgi:hypothetical protein